MRLLFLCSSLEPGRDGVGDYVRMLAQACTRQGHSCALLALRDPHITTVEDGVLIPETGGKIPLLRLPATLGLGPGSPAAVAFRQRFAPDWISLQLVAYGLHPRGLLFAAIPVLREIIGGTPLHLMLHELWLGNDEVPTWRHRLVGFLQRRSLCRLLSVLKPRRIATSNPVYAALLKTIGVEADILPLFGNIPISGDRTDLVPLEGDRGDWWVGLFFGGLYPQWKPEPFFSLLSRAATQAGKRVCLVLAGNAGGDGQQIWDGLARDYSHSFRLIQLGPQPAAVISSLTQSADFGIAASPWSVIGKSGSVAAMLDHGLPVIVTRDDFQPRVKATLPPSTDPLLHRCDEALEAKLSAGLPRRSPLLRVNEIAATLVRQLTESESPARKGTS